jgi:hypothetical protein
LLAITLFVPGPSAVAAGASVEPALFKDITAESGIQFVHTNGSYGQKFLPETMGGGVAFLDYDRDGDQDLLFINSDYWPGRPEAAQHTPTSALYRNRGDGSFEDVSAATGLDIRSYGMGVAVGDFDADGWDDLYITALGANRLLRNDGGRRFVDVTEQMGVSGGAGDWSTAAAFVDYDADGDLDLLVLNYVEWSAQYDLDHPFHIMGIGRSFTSPKNYRGSQPYLFENTGAGFRDVSAKLRVTESTGEPVCKGLGLAIVDYDENGLPDFFVANDSSRNVLFRNRGEGRFSEEGIDAGIAFEASGGSTAAMGIDAAWRDNGRVLQLAIGNFSWEMSSYFVAEPGGDFVDESLLSGFGPATREALTFGVFFFDYDLDGVADLLHANGHIEPAIDSADLGFNYAQPPQLFRGCAGENCTAPFAEVAAGADFSRPLVGRGAAYADIDGDGDQDIIITQVGASPRLLRNDQRSGNNWLRVRLHDGQRPVLGAQVTLKAGGAVQRQQLELTKSYLSSMEAVLTFGLGNTTAVEPLRVRWPDGREQVVEVAAVNRVLDIDKADTGPAAAAALRQENLQSR